MTNSRKTQYHSTLSRRDFMKFLGLGAASVGLASAARPLADLDEAMASPVAESVQPFWVKNVSKPTIEIDWDVIQRFDQRNVTFASAKKLLGDDRYNEVLKKAEQRAKNGAINNTPGLTVRDQALEAAAWGWRNITVAWTGDVITETPEERGIPQWKGTPEEAARTVRVAARYFGASDVGFVKLTEQTKKLIFTSDRGGSALVFEDTDKPYEEPKKKRVIPTGRDLWGIVFMIPQSLIMTKRGDVGGFGESVGYAYARVNFTAERIHSFLHALGYWHMGGDGKSVGPTPAWGTLAGLGEMSRTNRLVSPKYGNTFRTTGIILTDLPLAESQPIDAGIWKFCQTCKKCAEKCPSGAISMADKPSREVVGPWNNPGIVGYYDDALKCWEQLTISGCSTCHAVCPYNKMDKAVLHDLVKFTIAKAPVFNGIIRSMDDAFGYGLFENPEDFWAMQDFPIYGLDPSRS